MKKYNIKDFQAITNEERILLALTSIANELHNIYSILDEMKRIKEK